MVPRAIELDLPLGEPLEAVAGVDRAAHLLGIPGVDPVIGARLARAFPSLAAVYAAGEERLAAAVGPVAAARIRWFLDAPISRAAMPGRRPRAQRGWHHNAA